MEIKQNLVKESKYSIKCPFEMTPEFVVVHNTANDASAENEVAYMISNDNKVSFHYAVDDKEIVQGVLETRNAYHAGDGRNGNGNRKGIAVEICYSKSGGDKFIQAEKNAAKFIASILNKYGWGIDKVKRHKDFANKNCPHRTMELGWDRFLEMIEVNLGVAKEVTTLPNLANYKGSSIVEALNSVGYDSSFANRKKMAAKLGIENYKGTAEQNIAMLNKLRGNVSITSYYPACNSKYSSIVDALNSIGVDSSFAYRKKIAVKNNIINYKGTYTQNNQMLDRLKAGRLIKL